MSISRLSHQSLPPLVGSAGSPPQKRLQVDQADKVLFCGNSSSEVPNFLLDQPKSRIERIKAWFRRAWDTIRSWFNLDNIRNWLSPDRLVKRMTSFYATRQAKRVLGKLKASTPEESRAIMAKPPLDKITYAPFKRPSTGISRTPTSTGLAREVMQHYKEPTYLHILESYGIKWSPFKVARDALQNFYDGQGQTLDGVNTQVTDSQGTNHVKISASATYGVEKLLALGATGKEDQTAAAGGFGEGAKMMAMVLLRDYGANKVTFRSGDWQADFTLGHPGSEHGVSGNTRGLMVKLTPLQRPIQGNDLEFDTTNSELASILRNGHRLFYGPNNPDFHNPTYENAIGGFKLFRNDRAPGRVYEAGQLRAFEREGNYDALPGLTVWSNQKVLKLTDRDRTALKDVHVKIILEKIISGMSQEEAAQGIQVLRRNWFYQKPEDLVGDYIYDDPSVATMLLNAFCGRYASFTSQKPAFLPDSLVAIDPSTAMSQEDGLEQLQALHKDGYIVVNPALQKVGVPDGAALLLSRETLLEKKATPVTSLTLRQQRRVETLRATLKSLAGERRPIKIVQMPSSARDRDQFKASVDGNSILVDPWFLERHSFAQLIDEICKFAQTNYSDKTHWFLNNLRQIEQLQAAWEQE